jgi:hypothetical protein
MPKPPVKKSNPKRIIPTFLAAIFTKFFGIEANTDITDEYQLLFRRNVVIKNVIFISNLLVSLFFFLLSVVSDNQDTRLNIVFGVAALVISFPINVLLKKLCHPVNRDLTSQKVASYIAAIYIVLVMTLVYLRCLDAHLETAGYLLIFYALVIISLYQDPKILSGMFLGLLSLITAIHIIFTYPIYQDAKVEEKGYLAFFQWFFDSYHEGADIFLRTLVFLLFYLILLILTSIFLRMQQLRIKELSERRKVQGDFANIVKDLFSIVTLNERYSNEKRMHELEKLVDFLGHNLALSEPVMAQLEAYTTMINQYDVINDLMESNLDQFIQDYEDIQNKIAYGAKIAKRVQLAQKTDTLLNAMLNHTIDEKFITDQNLIQDNLEASVILICDLYLSLRSSNLSHRPFTHSQALETITEIFSPFFPREVLNRFVSINKEIGQIYLSLDD